MSATLDLLIELLDVKQLDENVYEGMTLDGSLPRVFGGLVAGQALNAASKTVSAGKIPISIRSEFLRPGRPGESIRYEIERSRDSRAFSNRRVSACQAGRLIFEMQASYHHPEAGLSHQYDAPRSIAPLDTPRIATLAALSPDEWPSLYRDWESMEIRYVPKKHIAGEATDTGVASHSQVWLRTNGPVHGGQALHSSILACASDLTLLSVSLVPHGVSHAHPGFLVASLDHCLWFHREFRMDEWLLYDQTSPSAHAGRSICHGRFFTEGGLHVATVMQEGLVRRVG
ncbi:acyl-CoA thioesterase II [Williamsia sp. DF01-3]|uniref:acyl-CoA thioesterase n=1 Tax=Williamsia sp. DF01-3 TaxID=2934157 RepID=UPI001FF3E44D|nr:acyl-CoA thioesterase II [Williamsia sp. DF01-3]MCK0517352.1 acyl-CoA thioesterase II [Williamsia sp. DF01-3]